VSLTALLQFGHNYNYPSRAAMYGWMNKHLGLGHAEPIVEEDYRLLSREEMSVWDADHPQPEGGPAHERALLRWLTQDAQRQLHAPRPHDEKSLAEYRRVVGGAVEVMIGRTMPGPDDVQFLPAGDGPKTLDGCRLLLGLVNHPAEKEQLPVAVLLPDESAARASEAVVWLGPQAKRALMDGPGKLRAGVRRLVDAGRVVVGVDLFGQGEFTADGCPISHTRLNGRKPDGPLPYAGYTFGYNHPVFAQRVHDILSVVALLRRGLNGRVGVQGVSVVGLRGAGHWAAAARAVAGRAIVRAAVDAAGFRFAGLDALDDPDFLPGAAKYDDLPGMLALSVPEELWLACKSAKGLGLVEAAYQAAGAAGKLTALGEHGETEPAAVDWLLRRDSEQRSAPDD